MRTGDLLLTFPFTNSWIIEAGKKEKSKEEHVDRRKTPERERKTLLNVAAEKAHHLDC
jgi:hypothetical protein